MPTLHIYVTDEKYLQLANLGNGKPHTIGKKWIEERLEKEDKKC